MADALSARTDLFSSDLHISDLRLTDATSTLIESNSVDIVLTSPPYCTRIDYTAATRIELAVLAPLLDYTPQDLSRQMTGSVRVPNRTIDVAPQWGATCADFLEALRQHPSKASSGYYYRTHLDYFDKMHRSIGNLSAAIRPAGTAILVIQDSFYKNLHNDLPSIVSDFAASHGLDLVQRQDFYFRRSMAGINPRARAYNRRPGAIEAVLCFTKR
jgi:hypothetical protein